MDISTKFAMGETVWYVEGSDVSRMSRGKINRVNAMVDKDGTVYETYGVVLDGGYQRESVPALRIMTRETAGRAFGDHHMARFLELFG